MFDHERRGKSDVSSATTPSLQSFITTLSVRHAFGGGWSADAALPAGNIRLDPGGGVESRRLAGFGDFTLGGAYDFAGLWGSELYRPRLSLRLAVGFPTGKESTIGDPNDPVPPSVLTIGTAAFSLTNEISLTQRVHERFGFNTRLSYRQPLSDTDEGVRFGAYNQTAGSLFVVPVDWLAIKLGGEYDVRRRAEREGMGVLVNSGARLFAVRAGVGIFAGPVSISLEARRPVFIDVNGTQIVESFSGQASLSVELGGGEEEDEHEHEHHDEHKHFEGGDVADAAVKGEAFDLQATLVPGKITVIDFWAEWCHPCIHVDEGLRELASLYPGLAVRRVEIVDDESPAAKPLGDKIELPIVWIFDEHGQRVDVLTATDEAAVRRRLGELLKGKPRHEPPEPGGGHDAHGHGKAGHDAHEHGKPDHDAHGHDEHGHDEHGHDDPH